MALSDRKFVVFKSSLLPGDSSFSRYSHFFEFGRHYSMPSWRCKVLGGDFRYLWDNLLRLVNALQCGSPTFEPPLHFVQGSED